MSSLDCVRRSLCCINLLFWILGCGCLGVGIWMHLAYRGYSNLYAAHQMLSGDSLLIIIGIFTFLLGFLGCCGSWFQNKCLLRMYFVLVIAVLLLEFTAGTLGFVYRKHVGDVLQDELLLGMKSRYTIDDKNGLKSIWDTIQEEFKCCGVRSYRDWHRIAAWPAQDWVPASCCLPKIANASTCGHMQNSAYFYSHGCYPRLHVWLMERLYVVGILSMVFAFIQLFGIISALIIVCQMNPKRR